MNGTMWVRPVKDRVILDPGNNFAPIEAPTEVPRDTFWLQAVRDGDVKVETEDQAKRRDADEKQREKDAAEAGKKAKEEEAAAEAEATQKAKEAEAAAKPDDALPKEARPISGKRPSN